MQTHETLSSFRKVTLGSNRKFGAAFSLLFAVLALWPVLHHGSPRWGLLAVAGLFLSAAILFPQHLAPLNRAWFKFGLFLNRIVSPVIMGGLFFGAVAPIGWYLRLTGRDLLHLKLSKEAPTYWIERTPPGPPRGTLTKQF